MDFYQLVAMMDEVGGFDVLLPFVLVFTLVFAVLQKIKLFGGKSKNINAVVALVISLFFLTNPYLIMIMQRFLPNVSIALIVFLMFLLLLGIFTGPSKFKDTLSGVGFFVALGAVLFALFFDSFAPGYYGRGGFPTFLYNIDPGTKFLIFLLVAAVIFIMFVMKDDEKPEGVKGILHKIGSEIDRE